MLRENDLIFFVGAGCSVEAGIPHTKQMISEIEGKVRGDDGWKGYNDLFNLTKSSIFYSRGIRGNFDQTLNIEEMVNILAELEKRDEISLLPFIGTWNTKLVAVAGHDFEVIRSFKEKIVGQLRAWITLKSYNKAQYYQGFLKFQSEYNFPLRVFSLNYDLCFEKAAPDRGIIERGFDPDTHTWHWSRFDEENPVEAKMFLYKLHGSIDWEMRKEEGNTLQEVEGNFTDPAWIFGTNYKLQYIDPYLFFAYELRKYSLDCRFIVTIGYGFNDEHINGILRQSLQNKKDRKILAISKNEDGDYGRYILSKVGADMRDQIIFRNVAASEFLSNLTMMSLLEQLGEKAEIDFSDQSVPAFDENDSIAQ